MTAEIKEKPRKVKPERTYIISVRLTEEEMAEVEQAVDIAGGMPKGTFARLAVVRAARAENAKALGL